jgi:hypothetical protein
LMPASLLRRRRLGRLGLSVMGALVLVRRDVIEQAVQPAGVARMQPFGGDV